MSSEQAIEAAVANVLHDPQFAHDAAGNVTGNIGTLVRLIADAVGSGPAEPCPACQTVHGPTAACAIPGVKLRSGPAEELAAALREILSVIVTRFTHEGVSLISTERARDALARWDAVQLSNEGDTK